MKTLSSFSSKALYYSPFDFRHSTLVLLEAAPLSTHKVGGGQAESLRVLLSEGVLEHEVVNPETMTTETKRRDGPVNFLSCNVFDQLDAELGTRVITIPIDSSPEQTRKVLHAHGDAAVTGRDLRDRTAFVEEIEQWRALFRWLAYQPTRAAIPYGSTLSRLLSAVQTRTRRDLPQVWR